MIKTLFAIAFYLDMKHLLKYLVSFLRKVLVIVNGIINFAIRLA